MKTLPTLAVLGVGSAILGYGAYRSVQPPPKGSAANAAFVRDRSDSTTSGCAAIGGLLGEFLRSGQAGPYSTVVAFATGDRQSNDEPVAFARMSGVRRTSVKDGHDSAARRDGALIADIVGRCETAGNTDRSPVYLAIRRALEELRALGCREQSHCFLYVQSDLEENAEASLKEALLGGKSDRLPSRLDNSGIRVLMCGAAETSGPTDGRHGRANGRRRRSAMRADLLPEVWRRLFTAPDLVSFEPSCPKATARSGDVAELRR